MRAPGHVLLVFLLLVLGAEQAQADDPSEPTLRVKTASVCGHPITDRSRDVRISRDGERSRALRVGRALSAGDHIGSLLRSATVRLTFQHGGAVSTMDISSAAAGSTRGFSIEILKITSVKVHVQINRATNVIRNAVKEQGFELVSRRPDGVRLASHGTMYMVQIPGPCGHELKLTTLDGRVDVVDRGAKEGTVRVEAGQAWSSECPCVGKADHCAVKRATSMVASLDAASTAGPCDSLCTLACAIERAAAVYARAMGGARDGEARLALVFSSIRAGRHSSALYHLKYVRHEGRTPASDWNKRIERVRLALGERAPKDTLDALLIKSPKPSTTGDS